MTQELGAGELNLLGSEYGNMLSCVRCGQCLTSCPTYVLSGREAEGPRGRVALARAVHEGVLPITPELLQHEQNCLVCDACTAVCPAGVHMDPLQVALRAAIEPQRTRGVTERIVRHLVFRRLFPNMGAFRLLVRLIWLYQRTGLQLLARSLGILKLLGLDKTEAFLPRVSGAFLVPHGETYPSQTDERTPVSFFAGCVMSTALAGIDRATIRVLQRAGCDVINVDRQGCCGALNAHGGDLPTALNLAKRTIASFEQDGHEGATPVIVNSAGCGAMLKDYAHHLRDDPEWAHRAAAFSSRVQDATVFLATRTLPLHASTDEVRVTYQEPCHLAHAQRIREQPRTLLQFIPGVTLCEMAESTLCCGSAGIYNLTNPVESRQLQQRKLDNALATTPDVIATANPGCLLHLQSGLTERRSPVQVRHIIELLDEASTPGLEGA